MMDEVAQVKEAVIRAAREFLIERTKLLDGKTTFAAVARTETALLQALERLEKVTGQDA